MKELNTLYKDLIKIQAQQEIERDIRKPSFWLGLFFILVSTLLAVNFMMV